MIYPYNISGSNPSILCALGKPIQTWLIMMLVILSIIEFSAAEAIGEGRRQERSLSNTGIIPEGSKMKPTFFEIGCRGVYNKTMFARLDRVCDDCYNLFREPQLHSLCRKDCFTSDFFKGCIDVLLLEEEEEKFKTYIKQLRGADFFQLWSPGAGFNKTIYKS